MVTRRQFQLALFFISPALLYFAVFWALPVLSAGYYSTTDWTIGGPPTFNGGTNYLDLLADPQFLGAVRNSLQIGTVATMISLLLALGLAIILNDARIRAKRFFRVAIILPVVTDWVATGLVWQVIFLPNQGVLASLGQTLGNEFLIDARWTGDADLAWWAIVIFIVWKQTGFYMIFLLASIRSVSRETIEAAQVDGAGGWRLFWQIKWPQMLPITVFVVVLAFVTTLGLFEPVFMLTGGGPADATRTLPMFLYQHFFLYGTSGYASAAGIYFLAISLVFAVVASRVLRDKVNA